MRALTAQVWARDAQLRVRSAQVRQSGLVGAERDGSFPSLSWGGWPRPGQG